MRIEEESGTYSGRTHSHNNYPAGDFIEVPFTLNERYAPHLPMPTYPRN